MKDGGTAFPRFEMSANGDFVRSCDFGMSLRDYFAAAALQTLAPIINSMVGMSTWHSTWSHIPPNEIAQGCYVMADAMLLERQKLQGKTE